ncbi:MAG: RNA-protein complex protein Nop10 [Thermofilaceae archaeon]|jgi:H/ACA ribonucleoprotein complex subunit 3|nr:RNA-protein complex protein Nop10 [Thermofilum sp.]MCC6058675.1 RNA-protein complex protein Nop10 [Thermofilum sp.]
MGRRGLLRRCTLCGRYTLREDSCPYCGGPVKSPHPAKFSPEDPYGPYRRRMKLYSERSQAS